MGLKITKGNLSIVLFVKFVLKIKCGVSFFGVWVALTKIITIVLQDICLAQNDLAKRLHLAGIRE